MTSEAELGGGEAMKNIVFVPGLLCTEALYAPQIEALPQGWHAQVADHRQDDSMEAIARRILDGAPDQFVLVGLSMGGYISYEIIRQAPKRVRGLVLIDTSARADRPDQTAVREGTIELAHSEGIAAVINEFLKVFIAAGRQDDKELTSTVRAMAKATGVAAFERQQRAIMGRSDAFQLLATLHCPTLVLCGDEDVLTPPKLAEEIDSAVPGAELEIIEGSGHLATLERPQAVSRALNRFLKRF